MKVPSPAAMAGLLRARLDEGGDPDRVITLHELLDVVLPYAAVRTAFQLAGKAEYDLAVLGLLASRDHTQVDPAVLDGVRKELEEGEPGLAFAAELGDSALRLRAAALRDRQRSAFGLVEPPEPAAEGAPTKTDPGSAGAELSSDDTTPAAAVGPEAPAPEPGFPGGTDEVAGPRATETLESSRLAPALSSPEPATAVGPAAPAADGLAVVPIRDPVPDVVPDGKAEERPTYGSETPEPDPEPRGCGSCGVDLPLRAGVRFCPACGASQREPRCSDCGDRVEAGWRFCARCGRELAGS